MALLKKVLKNDPRDVIVKWTGNGTDTLTLSSLTSTGQTVLGTPAAGVHIVAVSSSIAGGGDCTITRNGEVLLHIHDNFEFQTDGIIQAVISENQGSDIVVSLANSGTLIIKLRKVQGYSEISY